MYDGCRKIVLDGYRLNSTQVATIVSYKLIVFADAVQLKSTYHPVKVLLSITHIFVIQYVIKITLPSN